MEVKIERDGDNVRLYLSDGAQNFSECVPVETASFLAGLLSAAARDPSFRFDFRFESGTAAKPSKRKPQ